MQVPTAEEVPPPADKAFALLAPMDIFQKLAWEFKELKSAIAHETQAELFMTNVPSYHAFNFAVTAWHMIDWVWASANEPSKDYLKEFFTAPRMVKKADLFEAMSKAYRCIHLCGQIANGSKHRTLWPSADDPDVRVSVAWEQIPLTANSACNAPLVTYKRHLVIRDGTADIPALDVFKDAVRTWDQLMGTWGFREDRLYYDGMEPLPWDKP